MADDNRRIGIIQDRGKGRRVRHRNRQQQGRRAAVFRRAANINAGGGGVA